MSDSLINKYRPAAFEEVFGHTEQMAALQRVLQAETRPHCYLLTGPSGVGKTTIARIIAMFIGAEIQEIDAASHSGVDDMRELVDLSQYMSLGGSGRRLYIIDECHTLSKNAWQALLKITEEPPEHFFVALCTTEPGKVPATIANQRAYPVQLKALPPALLGEYLDVICGLEGWRPVPDVLTAVVQGADGSPRKALMLLLAVHDCTNRDEVRRIVNLMDESDPVRQIGKILVGNAPTWTALQPYLAKMEDDQFDGAFVQVGRYMLSIMTNEKNTNTIAAISEKLNALVFPSETFDPKVRFYAALGRICWPGN